MKKMLSLPLVGMLFLGTMGGKESWATTDIISGTPVNDISQVKIWFSNPSYGASTSTDMVRLESTSRTIDTGAMIVERNDSDSSELGWENPFHDVTVEDWFYESVCALQRMGVMSGTTSETFSPYHNTSRGMLVTMLHSYAGKPSPSGGNPFADVDSTDYFANATTWASENGIVSGINGLQFAPDNSITRQEVVTILYSYYNMSHGVQEISQSVLNQFTDWTSISVWARAASAWACANGLVSGRSDGRFDPLASASRGEIAVILNHFFNM